MNKGGKRWKRTGNGCGGRNGREEKSERERKKERKKKEYVNYE